MTHFLQHQTTKIFIATILVISSLTFKETTTCNKLSNAAQHTSMQFKLLNGSNRITEAKELLQIIVNDKLLMVNETTNNKQETTNNFQVTTPNPQPQTTAFSFSELKKIFGTPLNENENGSLTYIYDYTNNKSFTFQYNIQLLYTEITFNN